MKKIFLATCLILTSLVSTAQRFGTPPGDDNTGRVLTYAYSAPSYTATLTVNPNAYETIVRDTLTGAQTVIAKVTRAKVGDKLRFIFVADGSNRIVTFSTGFSTTAAYTVTASQVYEVDFAYSGFYWSPSVSGNLTTGLAADGTVGAPGIGFTSDNDNGFYRIGANHWAAAVGGSKTIDFNTAGTAFTGTISATGIQTPIIQNAGTTYTATGAITVAASEVATGALIAATATATTTMTLPTAAQLATQFSAVAGTVIEFYVINSGGTNGTVTVAVGSGMVASGFPSSNTLTLAGSATVGIAGFRIAFISASACTLTRIN